MASNSIVVDPECRDHSVIDIPHAECCIYRVPKLLRNLKKEAYTPKLVSIGPFHHGEEELRDMEMHKPKYLEHFLDLTGTSKGELLNIIKDNEVKIRRCYSETFDQKYCSEEFVNMILLDAIFIIELFLRVRDNKKGNEAEAKKTNCLRSLLPYLTEEKEAEEKKGGEAKKINCLRSLLPCLKEEKEAEEEKEVEEEKDYILRQPWLEIAIYYDLMLLENQLPFFVLEKLYMFAFDFDSSTNHCKEGKSIDEHKKDLETEDARFVTLSRTYFQGYDKQPSIKIGKEVKHFTDLIRYLFCSVPNLKPRGDHLDHLYCATKLDDAGLKFKRVDQKIERCLLDIRFAGNKYLKYFPCLNLSWLLACLPCFKCFPCLENMQCILEVPPFEIYDSTEALFRNLMALEQCHYPFNAYICNYVMLLDFFIDTERDVDLLVDKNVIVKKIGSNKEVANLINKLCFQIPEGKSCYAVLGNEINEYSNNPWNRLMASLKSTYFHDFWRGSTTMVGLIVLGFTLWGFLRLYL